MNHDDSNASMDCAVAIIGMAGRFPGAPDLDAYWRLLDEGREGIATFAPEELEVVPVGVAADDPRLVRAQGTLDRVEYFDAAFFNIPAREARWMDPQHRLFLETCWEALEDAGCDPERFPGSIALYAGANLNTYLLTRLDRFDRREGGDLFQIMLANDKDFLATRVAYKLDLRGESIGIQTSCSTSLVAVHMACQSLLSGQSEVALAGGVSVRVPQRAGYVYQEGMIASPDGHCRPFDERAAGTVPGSGVGVVVLKLLADALRDGDTVHAVVLGSAINNDGRHKAGFTAPSVSGQSEVIAKAIAMAGVEADSIDYMEAHGTGTPIGDPIEVEALTRVFGRGESRARKCVLGSVKSNIGHLDAAAGVAGLIKAVLALRHGRIPGTVHFRKANPNLGLERGPFEVHRESQPWPAGEARPRRCGVSSFGVGGTNAHLVLQEAPPRSPAQDAERPRLFTLSAHTPSALAGAGARLAAHLRRHPDVPGADVAATLALGRKAFPARRAFVASDREALLAALDAPPALPGRKPDAQRAAFLFPGQGDAAPGMAEALMEVDAFRTHLEHCADLLRRDSGFELLPTLFPARHGAAVTAMNDPALALPCLFAVEYAMARMWIDIGIEPAGLIGHSFGEYVAACVSGVFSLEDGLRIAVGRGRLMQTLPAGAMLAVHAPAARACEWEDLGVGLATVNGDDAIVLSGPVAAIGALGTRLEAEGVGHRRLPVLHAYHSADVERIVPALLALFEGVRLEPPRIPFVSSLSGNWIDAQDIQDPAYWARQMRQPVRFAEGLRNLAAGGVDTFIEVGPAQTLASMTRRVLPKLRSGVHASLPPRNLADERGRTLLASLGQLWCEGWPVRLEKLPGMETGARVPLPTYPFERQRYWIDLAPPSDTPHTSVSEVAGDTMEHATAAATARSASPSTAVPVPSDGPSHGEGRHRLARTEHSIPYEAPRDEIEVAVVEAWEGVLGLQGLGRQDHVLDLGADSLLATQAHSRLSARFPGRVRLADVLVGGSLAEMAERIRHAEVAEAEVPMEIVPRDGDLPLSFGQEWLWSIDQSNPGSPAYNFPYAARVQGPLDAGILAAAFSTILERHEVLRAFYPETDGHPVQRVHPPTPFQLPVIDLRALPLEAREGRVHECVQAEARKPFDMQAGPMFRASLLRLDDADHVVLITMHHIVSDAWSMGVFARELSALYPALRDGRDAGLPVLRAQYADYAAWQRRREREGLVEAQLDYWRRQLAGAPQRLDLPATRPRPERASGRGDRIDFGFRRGLADDLRRVAAPRRATLFMTLLGGFSVLLHRWTERDDLLLGIPVAGRTRTETEDLIGCFINTLAIRSRHESNPRFDAFLTDLRETTLAAYAHQEVPFERVVQGCRVQREPGVSPLVQVLFDFQNIPPRPPLAIDGLSITPLTAELATAKLDLVIDMWEREQGLAGSVEFNADLFDAADIRALLERYEALLEDIARQPEARISALSMRGAGEARDAKAKREADGAEQQRRFSRAVPKATPVGGERT